MQDVISPAKESLEGEMKVIAETQKKLNSKRLQYDAKRYTPPQKNNDVYIPFLKKASIFFAWGQLWIAQLLLPSRGGSPVIHQCPVLGWHLVLTITIIDDVMYVGMKV